MTIPVQTNPYAPPRAQLADPAQPITQPLAGRFVRLVAFILDIVLYMAASVVVILACLPSLTQQSWDDGSVIRQVFAMAVGLVIVTLVLLLVQGWLLVKTGQTLGKMALGIRIVRPDGSPASASRLILLRCLLCNLIMGIPILGMLFWLVDSLTIFRASHRCLHDDIADTLVVTA